MIPLHWSVDVPAPDVVWGLFVRGLGVIYFIAIVQLYHQVLPLAGKSGLSPVQDKLARIRCDYPGWRHWLYFPTVLWLDASDRFMRGLIVLGAVAALGVVYGGPLTVVCLLICWVVYLSLDIALGFSYPWDNLLQEAGFLALFLPELSALPDITITTLPMPALAWAYRWLLFRLMFGFGKYKFIGGSLRDTGYFRSFMINIPLPTYLSWYAFRLPRWVFQGILLIVFTAEIILPFGVFLTGAPRLVVAITISCLMVGIQLVGNFGFFNMLTIVLCIPLLDSQASLFDTSWPMVRQHWLTHSVMLILAVGGLLNLPFNSWCTQTWLHWPSLIRVRVPVIQALLRFYRAISRFRVVNSYGVFPPKSSPPIRWVPVFEGTRDGTTWEAYEYRYMVTTETTPPRFVAPYHPRFDHAIFYESFGTNDANFACTTLGGGNPYDFSNITAVHCVMQRLLEGQLAVRSLFRYCPFPADAPPTAVRMTLYRFQATTSAERRRTGRWWTRTFVSTHLPPMSLDSQLWEHRYPIPELFHPDLVHWKRRAPRIRALQKVVDTNELESIWQAVHDGLMVDLSVFWEEFIPLVNESGRDWSTMEQVVDRFRTHYNRQHWEDLEIILNRLSLGLLTKLEPFFLGKAEPQLVVSEYFQLCLFTHHLIGKGLSVYIEVLLNPTQASQYLSDFEPEPSFYYLGLFRFDTLVYQARKFRLALKMSTVQWGNGLPGFLELIPFISQLFKNIGEESLPIMHCNPDNGEWLVLEKEFELALTGEPTYKS